MEIEGQIEWFVPRVLVLAVGALGVVLDAPNRGTLVVPDVVGGIPVAGVRDLAHSGRNHLALAVDLEMVEGREGGTARLGCHVKVNMETAEEVPYLRTEVASDEYDAEL